MLFIEFRFYLFFLVAFGVHWSLRSERMRKLWLLACSYFFYGAWDWRFLGLILASTLIDYVAALRAAPAQDSSTDESQRRKWLIVSLGANLGLLGVFKYFDFFVESAADLLASVGLNTDLHALGILLPVGISFYTFQTLSYTIDVYQGRLAARRNLLDVALFVSFFPQLVAGPIVRARDFLPQLDKPRRFAQVDVRAALLLFLVGFTKKACISDNLSVIVDALYADPAGHSLGGAWTGMIMYSVQVYCDFSGYSDMAIATAALLGYRLCLNFHHPYLAANISDFWRRWHISLSSWLRDYLFVPLGGSRGGFGPTCRNLSITFVLCGLWHGASWNFVIFGCLHALAMCTRLVWQRALAESHPARRFVAALGIPLTFAYFTFTLVFFRAHDLKTAAATLRAAFLPGGAGESHFGTLPLLLFAGLTAVHICAYRWPPTRLRRLPDWGFAVAYALMVALALALVPLGAKPFVYFQF